jgi:hypothetical protein
LLEKVLEKQGEIYSEMQVLRNEIYSLIIVQIPNKNAVLINEIEQYFEKCGRAYDNQKLVIWLSNKKENLDAIEDNVASPHCLYYSTTYKTSTLPRYICPLRRSVRW